MPRVSIRFYKDREVQAIWDEEKSKWWFSVLDIVGAINEQDDHAKTATIGNTLKPRRRRRIMSWLVTLPN